MTSGHDDGCLTFWHNKVVNNVSVPRILLNLHRISTIKREYNFVCAHTANAVLFFPAIIVVTSNVSKNVNVALVDYLCQGFYALKTLYGTCVT